jgi:hypothetical protein
MQTAPAVIPVPDWQHSPVDVQEEPAGTHGFMHTPAWHVSSAAQQTPLHVQLGPVLVGVVVGVGAGVVSADASGSPGPLRGSQVLFTQASPAPQSALVRQLPEDDGEPPLPLHAAAANTTASGAQYAVNPLELHLLMASASSFASRFRAPVMDAAAHDEPSRPRTEMDPGTRGM